MAGERLKATLSNSALWAAALTVVVLSGCAGVFALQHNSDAETSDRGVSAQADSLENSAVPAGSSLWVREIGRGTQVLAVERSGSQLRMALTAMGGYRCYDGRLTDETFSGTYRIVTAGSGAQGEVDTDIVVEGNSLTIADSVPGEGSAVFVRAEGERYADNESAVARQACG